jgi:hypothetical protein
MPPASTPHTTTVATLLPKNGLGITLSPKLTTTVVDHLDTMVTWQREAGKGTA